MMKQPTSPSRSEFLSRRKFLSTGATFLTAVSVSTGAPHAAAEIKMPDSMLYPGTADEPYGKPSKHESQVVRLVKGLTEKRTTTWSYSPIHRQRGIITPSGLHFGTHHSGIPDIAPDAHRLYVHGMTQKSLSFSVADLLRYPLSGNIRFLECSGNSWQQGAFSKPAAKTCAELYGLVSGSEWIGVPVRLLLNEAGIDPRASWVIAEGADSGSLARSIPVSIMNNDAIVALYQNGERLRPAQGYPMRLLLPGIEGNMNVKWLRRLEVTDRPAFTKDESRAYTETLADGSIEGFSLYMGVKSVITHPSAGQVLPDRGYYEVSGLAWSGFGRIRSVEVSDDGGASWHAANLHDPVLDKALTRFSLPWRWTGQEVRLQSRATDARGNVQPGRADWRKVYHAGSVNHYNAVQTWFIDRQGAISNVF
ncbi:MAG: sulfite dehydrogenase [Pseudomonadota bacterium]